MTLADLGTTAAGSLVIYEVATADGIDTRDIGNLTHLWPNDPVLDRAQVGQPLFRRRPFAHDDNLLIRPHLGELRVAGQPLHQKARREQRLAAEAHRQHQPLGQGDRMQVHACTSGRFMRRFSHITPIRSTMPTQSRLLRPYLEVPRVRSR